MAYFDGAESSAAGGLAGDALDGDDLAGDFLGRLGGLAGQRLHLGGDDTEAPTRLAGAPGERLSLLAVGGPASGVTTTGLRWPLADDTLEPGSSRGVSNEFTGTEAAISLTSGVLLAIAPDPRST